MWMVTLYWVLVALMIVGVFGAVLPLIPGPSLILAAILVWCIVTKFAIMGWPLVLAIVALILSAAVEPLATFWGANQMGASKWSQFGAFFGMVAGFLGLLPAFFVGLPFVGILFGAVLGAFLGEFLYRRELAWKERLERSLKSSVSIVVGSIIGNVVEVLLAIVAIVLFLVQTWPPMLPFAA